MPDANKLAKLLEVGYCIPITCGLCNFGVFAQGQDWGTCRLYQYEHLKHTGPARDVSIIRFGSCPKGEVCAEIDALLGGHRVFRLEQK
ncbi:MAG: hypothetical protein A2Y38_02170 [Spirochaetes bacterium GWB1_59_5]|nr:MAG: hypothetical protein A2Y38_02170 [Spirochaetes bacterium GWB1_59_5]